MTTKKAIPKLRSNFKKKSKSRVKSKAKAKVKVKTKARTKPAEKRPVGRPRILTTALGIKICDLVCENYSLNEISKIEGMPDKSQILRWNGWTKVFKGKLFDEFRLRYKQSCEIRLDALADDLLDIADDGTNDWVDRLLKSGETIRVVDHEHISRSVLRVNTRMKLLGKLHAAYKDKSEHKHDVTDPMKKLLGEFADADHRRASKT